MYKVLIVDDENLSRYVIRDILLRSFAPHVTVLEASNGHSGIAACRAERPDLVIMDIRMPGMSGLEASAEILRLWPETFILILSAYDEFEFAKQAIQIGVKGYLLKPIREEEGVETIRKAFQQIGERARKGAQPKGGQELSAAKPYLLAELVDSVANGIFDDTFQMLQLLARETLENGYFMVAQLAADDFSYEAGPFEEKMQKVRGALLKRDAAMPEFWVGSARYNQIPLLFASREPTQEEISGESRRRTAECLLQMVMDHSNLPLRMGVGEVAQGVSNLQLSYHQAITALQKLRYGRISLFRQEEMETVEVSAPYPQVLEQAMVNAMRCRNKEDIHSAVNALVECLSNSVQSREVLKTYSYEILTVCIKTVRELAWVDIPQTAEYYRQLSRDQSKGELLEQLKEMLTRITFPLLDKEIIPHDAFKTTISKYIAQNIAVVTLESAAQKAHLTPQYFSKVFKDEFKINFVEYLKDLRLSMIRSMLKDSPLPLDDLCNRVGYTNNAYFSRLFKKETGFTPTQYRMKMMGIERK